MRLRKTFYSLTVAGLFGVFVAGCGGGGANTNTNPPPPPTAHEVLFANSAAGIQAFSIDSGTLTALASTPDSDLSLFITGNMLTAASGNFLLVTDSTGAHIKVFSINQSTGGLTPVIGSPFAIGGAGSGSLAMDSSGEYLYAPYLSGVAAFMFNSSTGTLSPVANSPFSDGSSPFAGAVDPSGKFFYTTGSTVQSGLSVYALNSATGALTPVAGSPFATPLSTGPYNLVVNPAGGTVYATVPSNNAVLGMTINPTSGTPSPVAGSPFSAVDIDMFLGLDPAGKFLYTCNEGNGTISAFTVNSANGTLTAIEGTPFGFSNCGTTVVVDPSGKYLYAANPGGNSITGFSIDATTGVLTMLNGSPFPATGATLITIAVLQ
ncbi:MAG: beta-propeller fold lactonase family protein [Candidatus Sulfotelmatobacter sp.]